MATKPVEPRTFTATVNTEGPSQVIRGKIPTGLIHALGGQKGDVIEFTVEGKHLTSARVLRGKQAETAKQLAHAQSRGIAATVRARTEKQASKPLPQPKQEVKAAPKKGNGKSNGKGNGSSKSGSSASSGKTAPKQAPAATPAGLNLGGLSKLKKGGSSTKKKGSSKGKVQYANK